MMKYSEIKLDDDEKTLLTAFKADGYKTIGKDFMFGLVMSDGFRAVSLYVLKGFDWIETNSYYEIDKLLNPPHEQKTMWDLEYGDVFWAINSRGHVYRDTWSGGDFDVECRSQGNVFLSKEEAKFEAKRREVVTKVRKYARPFVPKEINYYPYYDYQSQKISNTINTYSQLNTYFFADVGNIKKAIEDVGEEDFKKYYLGVKDEY